MPSTCVALRAAAVNGRAIEAIKYPTTTNGFLLASLSDHHPLNNFSSEAVLSAAPSIAPIKLAFAPRTPARKIGSSG